MAQRSRVLGLATLALGCLVGRGAAKPPDLPADTPVVAAPQFAPTDGPVPNRWLDPDPVFRPQPAPAAPARPRLLGPIATASLLHTVHPLLALLPRERAVAAPRPERLPMPCAVPAERQPQPAEEQETPPSDGFGWLHGVEQFGLCWAQQATETVRQIAAVEHPVAAADESRVDRLMRACYRAVEEGRHARAAALARRAHRLDPVRVEGDPLVYKLDLLSSR